MTRQCPSCGGICKRSGCERANVEVNLMDAEPVARLRFYKGEVVVTKGYETVERNGEFDVYTHPTPAVVQPQGWLHAIDEAMVCSHLGVANESDTYENAKKKLNTLICWNVDVAIDPTVNGGRKLYPDAVVRQLVEALEAIVGDGVQRVAPQLQEQAKAALAAVKESGL